MKFERLLNLAMTFFFLACGVFLGTLVFEIIFGNGIDYSVRIQLGG